MISYIRLFLSLIFCFLSSIKNIKVAKIHAKKSDLKIRYIATSPEQKLIKEKFDVVLSLEVVEHVKNLDLFFKSSSSLLRENGIMFVATLNRTFESYIKAIVGAEYILRSVSYTHLTLPTKA